MKREEILKIIDNNIYEYRSIRDKKQYSIANERELSLIVFALETLKFEIVNFKQKRSK